MLREVQMAVKYTFKVHCSTSVHRGISYSTSAAQYISTIHFRQRHSNAMAHHTMHSYAHAFISQRRGLHPARGLTRSWNWSKYLAGSAASQNSDPHRLLAAISNLLEAKPQHYVKIAPLLSHPCWRPRILA
jgi:hypothetical protein